jgi:hypothetical protein
LTANQRTLLSLLEASLWAGAIFAPWLLPALNEITVTLTLCADTFAPFQGAPRFSTEELGVFVTSDPCFALTLFVQ